MKAICGDEQIRLIIYNGGNRTSLTESIEINRKQEDIDRENNRLVSYNKNYLFYLEDPHLIKAGDTNHYKVNIDETRNESGGFAEPFQRTGFEERYIRIHTIYVYSGADRFLQKRERGYTSVPSPWTKCALGDAQNGAISVSAALNTSSPE